MPRDDYTEGLNPTKALTDGRVWGVLAKMEPYNGIHPRLSLYSIPILTSSKTWTASPATAKLEFPLQAHELDPSDSQINSCAGDVFINTDPAASEFGQWSPKVWHGDVLFSRTDGKDTDDLQVRALLQFLEEKHARILRGSLGIEVFGVQRQSDFFLRLFTPEAFHASIEESRRWANKNGVDLKSPVQITRGDGATVAGACGFCFASGKPLLRFGGCEERLYCGRACQKRDWRDCHKGVCSRAWLIREV